MHTSILNNNKGVWHISRKKKEEWAKPSRASSNFSGGGGGVAAERRRTFQKSNKSYNFFQHVEICYNFNEDFYDFSKILNF